MKKLKSILVTGCGGGIGTGIGRILKELDLSDVLVGTDLSRDHAGISIFDACEVLPRADSERYLEEITKVVKKYDCGLIIPMSEAEIRYLYQSGNTGEIHGTPLIMADTHSLQAGLDKLKTHEFLTSLGVQCPWTYRVNEHAPKELPCILKSRLGRGSSGVEIVDKDSVAYFTAKRPDDIWQEYLTPDDQEYTCCLYGCNDGTVRSISMKRKLAEGVTMAGEVVQNQAIDDLLMTVAKGLNVRGSINVQLRLTDKGPMIFEINPRFSSTVVFRHKLGFKDLLWSIEERTGNPPSPYVPPKIGTKFYKGYTEYIQGTDFV